jgi:hypothetical protein
MLRARDKQTALFGDLREFWKRQKSLMQKILTGKIRVKV